MSIPSQLAKSAATASQAGAVTGLSVAETTGLTRSLDTSRFTWKHGRLYGITISGQFFDGFDATMLGVLLPGIALQFSLSKSAVGTLAASAAFGMLIGAIAAGFLADWLGRRTTLMLMIGEFAVLSACAALAPNFEWLLASRALQGVGLGAEVAILFAYLAEFLPVRRRGVFLASSSLLYQAAGFTSAVIALFLVPLYGWRVMFAVGALPLVTVLLMWLYLPESVRFLLQKGRGAEAVGIVRDLSSVDPAIVEPEHAPAAAVPAGPVSVWNIFKGRLLRVTLGIWFMNLTSGFVFFAILNWLPSILIAEGYSFAHSLQYTAAISLSGAIGAISVGVALEAIGRKKTVAICFFCGGCFLALWSRQHTEAGVLIVGLLAAFFCFGIAGALNSYTGEVYPTALRARGAGWGSGWLRIGGITAPQTVGIMLDAGALPSSVFAMLSGICLVSSVVALLMIYETKGRSMEEIAVGTAH